MKLTRGQRRALRIMNREDEPLTYEKGAGWWLGNDKSNGKLGLGLLRLCLISPDSFGDDQYQNYWINSSGLRALNGDPPYANGDGQYFDTLEELLADRKASFLTA